jgi:hypothetical protein
MLKVNDKGEPDYKTLNALCSNDSNSHHALNTEEMN